MRRRRFLRRTRAGLRFDKKALEKEVGFEIVVTPQVMESVQKVIPYLDAAQFYYSREMNRTPRSRNPELYKEMETRRGNTIRLLADILSQPHPRALGRWALKNFREVVHLVTEEAQEEVARELEKFYLFPALKT